MKAYTKVTISGIIGGTIWMPAATCGKPFRISDQEYPYGSSAPRNSDVVSTSDCKPTLREMVLQVLNDGDFQSCQIADASVTLERITATPNGEVIRRRHMDIRQFPSVADCVLELESDKYYAVLDCFQERD